MRHLMRGRTVLVISHRPSTLERCAELLVLESGRVVTDTIRSATSAQPPVVAAAIGGRRSQLKSHPAIRAWCELYPQVEPVSITPLRVRKRKSSVYRLEGAGQDGSPVIAKRCPRSVALVERTVYEDILARLTLPSLRYYGFVDEPDAASGWLFMEEARGPDYSNLLPEHRARAGRWLGLLHAGAAGAAAGGRLPDGGPGRYLARLRELRETLGRHLDNPVLSPEDVAFLEGLLARFDELAARWPLLQDVCHGVPPTLVHGDFNGRNIRLRSALQDATITVFDWEDAGWGVPAVDLAQQLTVPSGQLSANPDIPSYWSAGRERWPDLSSEACWRLAYCGTVFRTLSAMSWIADDLANDWAHASLRDIRLYAAELDGALERLDWVRRTSPPQREVAAT